MKKTILLLSLAAITVSANAQLTLPASSPYTQNFDGLPTYPIGWTTYNNATATTLGSTEGIQYFGESFPSVLRPDTGCIGTVNVGGFKNFPSGTVCHQNDDFCATTPPTYTNRALGVRQVSPTNATHPNLDPGAAFVLKLANTTGHKNFQVSFLLQSLDTSSARVTTWSVDYGMAPSATGTPTTFTTVAATGTMTTGGHAFSSNTVTATFPAALNNSPFPVYIRIVALSATAGSFNRPSSAIDDYTLTYANMPVGIEEISAAPQLSLLVLGQPARNTISFLYDVEESGTYSVALYDFTGRVVSNKTIEATAGKNDFKFTDLNLAPGVYIARMSSSKSSCVAKMIVE